jgi:hypothetical protein
MRLGGAMAWRDRHFMYRTVLREQMEIEKKKKMREA